MRLALHRARSHGLTSLRSGKGCNRAGYSPVQQIVVAFLADTRVEEPFRETAGERNLFQGALEMASSRDYEGHRGLGKYCPM